MPYGYNVLEGIFDLAGTSGGGGEGNFSGRVTTTDDTPTLLAYGPMNLYPATYLIKVDILLYDVTDNIGVTSTIVSGFRTVSASDAPIPLTNEDFIDLYDPGNPDEDVQLAVGIDVDGFTDEFQIIVTGDVGKTIHWKAVGVYLYVN